MADASSDGLEDVIIDSDASADLTVEPDDGSGVDYDGDVPIDIAEDAADAADQRDAQVDEMPADDPDAATDPDLATDTDLTVDPDIATDPDVATDSDVDANPDVPTDPGTDPDVASDPDAEPDPDVSEEPDVPPLPPEAAPDTYNLVVGETLIVPNPGVLGNDTTFGGPLIALEEASTSNGSLTLGAGGGFTYIHDRSQTILDTFTYRAVDGGLMSDPVTVSLLINHAPVASNQQVTVLDDETVSITLGATDLNDDDLTFAIGDAPLNGELTNLDALAGTVEYTPDPGFFGSDDLTFTADDGELESNEATVTLSVNAAPGYISLPPTQTTLGGRTVGPLTITVDDPDDDPADVTLSASSDRQDIVSDINIVLAGTGQDRSLTLTTQPDTAGVVTIALELSDGQNVVAADLGVHVGVTNDIDDSAVPGSIRRVLEVSQSGDVLTFDPDHFNVDASVDERTISLQSQLDIDRDLTFDGPGRDLLILSGNDLVRVLFVDVDVIVTLTDLSIADGSDDLGAGIYNNGGTVSISNVMISSNVADSSGGGIYNTTSGVDNDIGGELSLTDCTLSDNGAISGAGGGIFNVAGGQVEITRCRLSGNSTLSSAGGAINSGGAGGRFGQIPSRVTIRGSTLDRNVARFNGGAVRNYRILTLTNVTLSDNEADFYGGGIHNDECARATLINSTLFGNRADSDGSGLGFGGGLYNAVAPPAGMLCTTGPGALTLHGTLVAGNAHGAEGADAPDDITNEDPLDSASSYNLIGDAATADILEDGVNGNIVGVDWTTVLEATLANNGGPTDTHALLVSSPAVNAIPTVDCNDADDEPLVTDQRGETRPAGGACDMGAYERQASDP